MNPFTRCPDCHKKGVQFHFAKVIPGEDGYGCRYCDFWFFTNGNDRMDAERWTRWEWANPDRTIDPDWRHPVWASVEEYAYGVASGDDWRCLTCNQLFCRHEMADWEAADDLERRRLGAENFLRAHAHRLTHDDAPARSELMTHFEAHRG